MYINSKFYLSKEYYIISRKNLTYLLDKLDLYNLIWQEYYLLSRYDLIWSLSYSIVKEIEHKSKIINLFKLELDSRFSNKLEIDYLIRECKIDNSLIIILIKCLVKFGKLYNALHISSKLTQKNYLFYGKLSSRIFKNIIFFIKRLQSCNILSISKTKYYIKKINKESLNSQFNLVESYINLYNTQASQNIYYNPFYIKSKILNNITSLHNKIYKLIHYNFIHTHYILRFYNLRYRIQYFKYGYYKSIFSLTKLISNPKLINICNVYKKRFKNIFPSTDQKRELNNIYITILLDSIKYNTFCKYRSYIKLIKLDRNILKANFKLFYIKYYYILSYSFKDKNEWLSFRYLNLCISLVLNITQNLISVETINQFIKSLEFNNIEFNSIVDIYIQKLFYYNNYKDIKQYISINPIIISEIFKNIYIKPKNVKLNINNIKILKYEISRLSSKRYSSKFNINISTIILRQKRIILKLNQLIKLTQSFIIQIIYKISPDLINNIIPKLESISKSIKTTYIINNDIILKIINTTIIDIEKLYLILKLNKPYYKKSALLSKSIKIRDNIKKIKEIFNIEIDRFNKTIDNTLEVAKFNNLKDLNINLINNIKLFNHQFNSNINHNLIKGITWSNIQDIKHSTLSNILYVYEKNYSSYNLYNHKKLHNLSKLLLSNKGLIKNYIILGYIYTSNYINIYLVNSCINISKTIKYDIKNLELTIKEYNVIIKKEIYKDQEIEIDKKLINNLNIKHNIQNDKDLDILHSSFNLFDINEINSEIDKLSIKNESDIKLLKSKRHKLEIKLYNILVKPVESYLKSYNNIKIIPYQDIYKIPLHHIILQNNIINLNKLSYINSLVNLRTFPTKFKNINDISSIIISDPTSDLKHANIEGKEVSYILKSENLITQENVNKDIFINKIKNYNIIHYCGHFYNNNYNPQESYFILDHDNMESNVYMKDIQKIDFTNTELFYLSGCCTSSANIYSNNYIHNITNILLDKGVKYVIGAISDIEDESSKLFTIRFFKNLTQNYDIEDAFKNTYDSIKKNYYNKSPYNYCNIILNSNTVII